MTDTVIDVGRGIRLAYERAGDPAGVPLALIDDHIRAAAVRSAYGQDS